MAEALEVHVNREKPNVLEVPDTFRTLGDFDIEIENGGQPVHLHINCDDALLAGLTLETGNHYIPRNGSYRIPVSIDETVRPFRGKCRMSIAYGSETRYVDIRVDEPEGPETVAVDESLATPRERPKQPPVAERIVGDVTVLALLFFGIVALLAGGVILASVTTPILGVVLVVVVLLIAVGVYLLFEES